MSETTSGKVTWLTQDAYDRLRAELEHLSGPGRLEISRKIELAREEGDLRENGGYHAAKEEQGKQEARIRQLTVLLRDAKVGVAPTTESGIASPGTIVTVRMDGDDPETFLIGSREDNPPAGMDILSAQSPFGEAIIGRKVGETFSFTLPNGRQMPVELVTVEPFTG